MLEKGYHRASQHLILPICTGKLRADLQERTQHFKTYLAVENALRDDSLVNC